jgi:hypothetical protein
MSLSLTAIGLALFFANLDEFERFKTPGFEADCKMRPSRGALLPGRTEYAQATQNHTFPRLVRDHGLVDLPFDEIKIVAGNIDQPIAAALVRLP